MVVVVVVKRRGLLRWRLETAHRILLMCVSGALLVDEARADEPAPVSPEDAAAAAPAAGAGPTRAEERPREVKEAQTAALPWIRRYRPNRGVLELGVAAGLLLPSAKHELYDYTIVWDQRGAAAANFVLRGGYYPLSFLGLEAEGALALSRCVCGGFAPIFGGRGQVIAQLPSLASLRS
jgi:hypothetical protein